MLSFAAQQTDHGRMMPPSYITRRLRDLAHTGRALAAHMAWTPSTLSRVVRGKRDLTVGELRRMAGFLGLTPEQLFRQIEATPGALVDDAATSRSMPLSGFIGPGGLISEGFPASAPPEARRLRTMRAVMRPADLADCAEVFLAAARAERYEPGDLLYCEPARLEQAVGRECVVTLAGGERLLRRLIGPGKRRGTHSLFSRDTALPHDAEIVAAAPVRTIRVLAPNTSGH